jgi:hypothetical protein
MPATRPIDDDIVASGAARRAEERSASNRLAGGQAEMPRAAAPGIFQGGLFVLAVLAALYAARRSSCQLFWPSCSSSCCNRRCEPCSGCACQGRLVRCC